MIVFLIVFIALAALAELISLKRDPDKVNFDCGLSAYTTEPGIPFEVNTIITNESFFPVSYLRLKENYPIQAELPDGVIWEEKNDGKYVENVCRISGRHKKKKKLSISIQKRGRHIFRGGTLEFGDFLGIREVSKRVIFHREIIVYPKRLDRPELTGALGSYLGDISAKRFLILDPLITIGCREYTGREPVRDIHWLQTARKGELMVREFDYTRQLSATVLLSTKGLTALEKAEMDECCSFARTICETLVELGVTVSFFTNASLSWQERESVLRCEASAGKMGALLEMLSCISSNAHLSTCSLFQYAAVYGRSDNAFIAILPNGETSGEEAAEELRRNTGQEVMLIYCGEGERQERRTSA